MKNLRLVATVILFCAAGLACAQTYPAKPIRLIERSAATPRSGDANFAPAADIIEKYEKLAVHALPEKRVAELRDTILRLEALDDAAELAALRVAPGAKPAARPTRTRAPAPRGRRCRR